MRDKIRYMSITRAMWLGSLLPGLELLDSRDRVRSHDEFFICYIFCVRQKNIILFPLSPLDRFHIIRFEIYTDVKF